MLGVDLAEGRGVGLVDLEVDERLAVHLRPVDAPEARLHQLEAVGDAGLRQPAPRAATRAELRALGALALGGCGEPVAEARRPADVGGTNVLQAVVHLALRALAVTVLQPPALVVPALCLRGGGPDIGPEPAAVARVAAGAERLARGHHVGARPPSTALAGQALLLGEADGILPHLGAEGATCVVGAVPAVAAAKVAMLDVPVDRVRAVALRLLRPPLRHVAASRAAEILSELVGAAALDAVLRDRRGVDRLRRRHQAARNNSHAAAHREAQVQVWPALAVAGKGGLRGAGRPAGLT